MRARGADGCVHALQSRFASSGKFTTGDLESGADLVERPDADDAAKEAEEPEDDGRSLYARLKEQKDLKQEEWEEAHKFKNQMDHWRLDEDDAAFEEERVAKLRRREAEAERHTEESKQFYRLARAAQERPVAAPQPARPAGAWADGPRKTALQPKKRPGPPIALIRPSKEAKIDAAPPAAPPAAAAAPAAAPSVLPGMGEYSDSDD